MAPIIGLGTKRKSRLLTNGRFIGHKKGVFGRKHYSNSSNNQDQRQVRLMTLPLDSSRKRTPRIVPGIPFIIVSSKIEEKITKVKKF